MLKAVVFDLDGTITRPFLNFGELRTEIGVLPGRLSVLDQIESLPESERARAWAILEAHEARAAQNAEFNDGACELLERISRLGLLSAVVTRNSGESTRRVQEKLGFTVDRVIHRGSGLPLKPDPASLLALAGEWGIQAESMLMVGDYVYDIQAGRDAGAITCFVSNGRGDADHGHADFVVEKPGQVIELIEKMMQKTAGRDADPA